MSLLPETKTIQSNLASYCRTGIDIELPGVTPNRLHHYRRLVSSIINDSLESAFPIAYQYIDNNSWNRIVQAFLSTYNCQSFQVWKIPGEFYAFTVKENYSEQLQIPYLNDLLSFEWAEMEIYNMEDIPPHEYTKSGNILNDALVVNPEFKILQLTFPIHKHTPVQAQENPGKYFVLIYRELETGKVQFVELSVWFALIIEQIHQRKCTISSLLDLAPQLFGDIDTTALANNTELFIKDMQQRQFILGFDKRD